MLWHASGSSNGCLPTRCSINGRTRCMGPMKRELGGRVNSNIVDDFWVSIGPPPPLPSPP
eukprot:8558034-Pyramimonas_sp.AAC.1